MAIVPQWYDNADELLDEESITVNATPGVRGTAVALKFFNNRGGVGADPIENAFIRVMARIPGDDVFVASGLPALDDRWIELRLTGGINWTVGGRDYTPVGPGAYFPIPKLENDRGLLIEVDAYQPMGGQATTLELAFEVVTATGQVIADGLTEATPDGIFLGLRDGNSSFLLRATDAVLSAPDVDGGAYAGVARGVPFVIRPDTYTIDAAASGKERFDLYVIDVDGTLQVLVGTEVTGTATDDDKPALDDLDQLPLFYARADDTGGIAIENVWTLGAYAATYSAASPVLTVGAGIGRVDNWKIRNSGSQSITLTLSATNHVWLLRSGRLAKSTDGKRPPQQPRALLLGVATVDGTGITAWVPTAYYIGHELERVVFDFGPGEVVEDEWRYAYLPGRRDTVVPPALALRLMVGEQAVTPASGATVGTIQARIAGTWTDLVTAAGDRPTIAFDAAAGALRASADLDLLTLPGDLELRAAISDLPVGSATDPKGVVMVLEVSP